MKTCTKCLEVKPLSEYALRSEGYYRGPCKACMRAYHRQFQMKLAQVTRRKKYRMENSSLFNEHNSSYRRRHRKECNESLARRRKQVPGMMKAHNAVARALAKGSLTKEPCSVCRNPRSHAHHEDYNKPLEVVWLCALHHKLHHIGKDTNP
mgnify:CR=1 FL=1